ncbi:hemin ABC transporter substrate-binding protein [Vibrio vulnificus]|uniref:heme/hemin ABC transporter substrate-binding protein n=1 Tax=Vibrio vulnificus TaxID=672 RepID=UPI000CD1569C|nr:hemin ABC transporter substrate-binding protein [Vibrio vulnificus]EGQ7834372.1 hemin ABC transporter substrate-binding protein [Vibrio vulnificus]EGQ7935932.1 hemin ABC transporter substrate-binding protein [Vibrio vulnificus]EGQ7965983.1 hemin ABC transporter substrate-binding protein [Vibrio vulnificus]EGQ8075192.1 hemin ABC transporter substrate-binding protein [Vibrio vulnificus]EGR0100787.1 hemin ABC transporter substrate-binding protein [Vibrio vulnificus]
MKKTMILGLSVALLSTTLSLPLQAAQERIISAGSAVTELILALHAEQSLVAVDVTSQLPEGQPLPKIGYHRRLSAEGLLALSPTKLIGSDEMGPAPVLQQLKSTGVDIEVVNTQANVDGLKARIDQIAAILNKPQEAQQLKSLVDQQVQSLKANQPTEQKKKVLFLLIHEGRAANVAGTDTTPDAIIRLAGAINPAADKITAYKPLSSESMVEMQPDVILVSGRSFEKLGGPDAIIKMMPLLAATPAGQNKQIMAIDGAALVGGLGLKSLAEAKRLNQLLYTQ